MATESSTLDLDLDFLASVEMFSAFSRDELAEIAEDAESNWYEFGDVVCATGAPSTGVQVIKTGSVRLFTQEENKEISLGLRKAGDVFAELAALREMPHEFSVRASAKAELLTIPRATIARLLSKNAGAGAFINSYVALRTVGGVVNRLFELRGKVDKEELEKLVRSVGAKRVQAGSVLLEQGSSDDK
ncbi:MAG: cyclic nucleotide-binding domain-containing protein, partial [Pseudomonadota bacterium]